LTKPGQRRSYLVGLVGNCADVLPELARRDILPDVLTDQTTRQTLLTVTYPRMNLEEAARLRRDDPNEYIRRRCTRMATHVRAMLELKAKGAVTFDYGNNIRAQRSRRDWKNAFEIPGFVLSTSGRSLSGPRPLPVGCAFRKSGRLRKTDSLALELFPDDHVLSRWLKLASERVQFQGLPARICWLGYGERAEFGEAMNDMVRTGKLDAPIVIGRDHLDTGSVASPYRETEGMRDGSDAIADWPLLNALLNTASGASWFRFTTAAEWASGIRSTQGR